MSRRNLKSFSFLIFPFLLAASFFGCGDQGSSTSGTTPPPPPPPGSWRGTQQFGTPFNDVGQGIARDSSANIYITGSTGGNLDGNTSSGQLDVFLTKFDSTGNKLFTRQIGTAFEDIGYAVAVDGSGNVFVTGSTGGSLPGNTSFGQLDVFLAKFDPSGTLLFARQFGTPFNDIGRGIALDGSGNIFITGWTEGSLGSTSSGQQDVFLAKIDPFGNLTIRQFGTPFNDIGYGVALDSGGNVFVTGSTGGSLPPNISFGQLDVFLARFDPSGNLAIQQLGTAFNDIGYGLAVDSSGNVFITGSTDGVFGANAFGLLDVFLVKFNATGVLVFTQQFGTPFSDIGYAVAVDSTGNVNITGSTDGSLGSNISAGQLDVFLAKFDPSGASLFASQFGTPFNDTGFGIAVDSGDNVFITGSTVGNLDGNISAGLSDIFLAKFNSAGVKQ